MSKTHGQADTKEKERQEEIQLHETHSFFHFIVPACFTPPQEVTFTDIKQATRLVSNETITYNKLAMIFFISCHST